MKSVTVWAAATGAGIGVCWLGVRPVLDAAVPDRLVAFPVDDRRTPTTPARPPHSATPSASARPSSSPSRTATRTASTATAASVAPRIVDGWTLFPDGQYVRSFQLVGGNATVRANRGVLELISATPQPGFVMTIIPTADDRVVVNFTGGLHVSTLNASWRDIGPLAEITEIP